jgi:hypothetical protein
MQIAADLDIISNQTAFLKRIAEALSMTGNGTLGGQISMTARNIELAAAAIAEKNSTANAK